MRIGQDDGRKGAGTSQVRGRKSSSALQIQMITRAGTCGWSPCLGDTRPGHGRGHP